MDALANWYALDLGDAVLAHAPLARIRETFAARVRPAGAAGIFVRYDSEGRLHCEVTVFFTPALREFAQEHGAVLAPRPARAGLELLAGDEDAWTIIA
jgi:hypothetical protein